MSKIRTLAMINTFVVYPIFMLWYFRSDIKAFKVSFREMVTELAEQEYPGQKITTVKGYMAASMKAGWNEGFNN